MKDEKSQKNGEPKAAEPTINLSDAERKKLFQAYEKSDLEVEVATKALDAALLKRSNCVEEIAKKSGNGPYRFKGVKASIMARLNKSTGKTTYFFRQPGEEQSLIDV